MISIRFLKLFSSSLFVLLLLSFITTTLFAQRGQTYRSFQKKVQQAKAPRGSQQATQQPRGSQRTAQRDHHTNRKAKKKNKRVKAGEGDPPVVRQGGSSRSARANNARVNSQKPKGFLGKKGPRRAAARRIEQQQRAIIGTTCVGLACILLAHVSGAQAGDVADALQKAAGKRTNVTLHELINYNLLKDFRDVPGFSQALAWRNILVTLLEKPEAIKTDPSIATGIWKMLMDAPDSRFAQYISDYPVSGLSKTTNRYHVEIMLDWIDNDLKELANIPEIGKVLGVTVEMKPGMAELLEQHGKIITDTIWKKASPKEVVKKNHFALLNGRDLFELIPTDHLFVTKKGGLAVNRRGRVIELPRVKGAPKRGVSTPVNNQGRVVQTKRTSNHNHASSVNVSHVDDPADYQAVLERWRR